MRVSPGVSAYTRILALEAERDRLAAENKTLRGYLARVVSGAETVVIDRQLEEDIQAAISTEGSP